MAANSNEFMPDEPASWDVQRPQRLDHRWKKGRMPPTEVFTIKIALPGRGPRFRKPQGETFYRTLAGAQRACKLETDTVLRGTITWEKAND